MHLYSAFIVYCHTPKALYNHVWGGGGLLDLGKEHWVEKTAFRKVNKTSKTILLTFLMHISSLTFPDLSQHIIPFNIWQTPFSKACYFCMEVIHFSKFMQNQTHDLGVSSVMCYWTPILKKKKKKKKKKTSYTWHCILKQSGAHVKISSTFKKTSLDHPLFLYSTFLHSPFTLVYSTNKNCSKQSHKQLHLAAQ